MNNITRNITRLSSVVISFALILVLARWFLDIPSFKSLLHGIASIKFNTTLCFILSIIVLYLIKKAVGLQCQKNSTYDFLFSGIEYNINEFTQMINEFLGKSLG